MYSSSIIFGPQKPAAVLVFLAMSIWNVAKAVTAFGVGAAKGAANGVATVAGGAAGVAGGVVTGAAGVAGGVVTGVAGVAGGVVTGVAGVAAGGVAMAVATAGSAANSVKQSVHLTAFAPEVLEARRQWLQEQAAIDAKLRPRLRVCSAREDEMRCADDTPVMGANTAQHKWCAIRGDNFRVRRGPDYATNRKKAPSGEPLCEVVYLKAFDTSRKLGFVTPRFDFPPVPEALRKAAGVSDAPGSKPPLPFYFVVQLQVPRYSPGNPMWGKKIEDGLNTSVVVVLRPTIATMAAAAAAEAAAAGTGEGEEAKEPAAGGDGAADLFYRFCKNVPRDQAMGSQEDELLNRLKFIIDIKNLEEIDTISAVARKALAAGYNAKPILGRPQLDYRRFAADVDGGVGSGSGGGKTCDVAEVIFDLHRVGFTTQVVLQSLIVSWTEGVFDFGVVVEGRGDAEMPERILTAFRLLRHDITRVTCFPGHEADVAALREAVAADAASGESELQQADEIVAAGLASGAIKPPSPPPSPNATM